MRLKILYVQLATKSFAGIERVVDELCSELAQRYDQDFEIDVLYTADYKDNHPRNRKYNTVQIVSKNSLDLMIKARKVIARNRYDLIVVPQVEPMVLYWTACLGLNKKFALHLHGNPKLEMSHFKARVMFYLMKTIVLHRLSCVFGTSPKQLDSFKAMFPSEIPHRWVPNPVRQFNAPLESAAGDPGCVTFVNVGRFAYQKGQDILIDSFARLYELRRNARLKIVGYGANESALRDAIRQRGLDEVVRIEHHPENPQPALCASDVYVSTSRWEGWSLAICEALRIGLPVVATDCDFGPSDILTDQRLGRLVSASAEDGLVKAMLYYCDNLKAEKAHAAYRRRYIDRFSVEQIAPVHADALKLAVQAR